MPALWNSEGTFVSVSQFLWLVLCFPFQSVSGRFLTPCLIVSLGGKKKKRGGKGERSQKEKNKLPADFKPVQRSASLLVFLDATRRGGAGLYFSPSLVLRGWGPRLGHSILSFSASIPGPPWAARLKSATQCELLTVWANLSDTVSLRQSVLGMRLQSASGCSVWDKQGTRFHSATQYLGAQLKSPSGKDSRC